MSEKKLASGDFRTIDNTNAARRQLEDVYHSWDERIPKELVEDLLSGYAVAYNTGDGIVFFSIESPHK